MDDQGGAGGVPLHGDDDAQRQRKPHAQRSGTGRESRPHPAPGPVRREDTDEASRLDRPGTEEQADLRERRGHGHGHD